MSCESGLNDVSTKKSGAEVRTMSAAVIASASRSSSRSAWPNPARRPDRAANRPRGTTRDDRAS